jgi:hypothetical protein
MSIQYQKSRLSPKKKYIQHLKNDPCFIETVAVTSLIESLEFFADGMNNGHICRSNRLYRKSTNQNDLLPRLVEG